MLIPFKQAYRTFVQANYPQLEVSPQTGRDFEYYIKGKGLPTGIRFKHAFFKGEVSLIFEKKWVPAAERWLAKQMPEGARIIRHSSELHVRMSVEAMDPNLPFDQQKDIAARALDRISDMTPWAQSAALA